MQACLFLEVAGNKQLRMFIYATWLSLATTQDY